MKKSIKIDIDNLRDPEIRTIYTTELNRKLTSNNTQEENPNETWNRIATTCKETASTILGLKEYNTRTSTSNEIKELSVKQKKLRDDTESTTNKGRRAEMKKKGIRF